MRSVVVVLPASMWAMIPMFRVFSRVNLRGMGRLSTRRRAAWGGKFPGATRRDTTNGSARDVPRAGKGPDRGSGPRGAVAGVRHPRATIEYSSGAGAFGADATGAAA